MNTQELTDEYIISTTNRILLKLSLNPADYDDAKQVGWIAGNHFRQRYCDRNEFNSRYLYADIKRAILYEFGSHKENPTDFQIIEIIDETPIGVDAETVSILRKIYNSLESYEKQLVYLRFWKDMSFSEIATTLKKSKSWAIFRTRQILDKIRHEAELDGIEG